MRFKQKLSPTVMLPSKVSQQGFTLIEIIVGIVVLSIAFSIFTSLIYPLANQSAKQVHQIKAAELGQSMINEIIAKAFDENSDMAGGIYRCGEDSNNDGEIKLADDETCTESVNLGPDNTETRKNFDDVDDYNDLSIRENSLGDPLNDIYVGYQIIVQVINDSDYDGDHDEDDNEYTAKLIRVTITTPQDFDFVFAVYRANF
ncbi:prepilin-type N-terminal cleavage/methylation domain-containing protein [Colwellia sp. MB02u-6]|jgi:MSHA pilin protein MshD|uniref:type IV pilus modification PilV family protein n=1 Tax=Colwellia sp. MB02u-6 TaxID=2759824 RepID=UPI00217518AE|nr:type II secretion system protein [Colwellia sp. MB02u-6]